MDNGYSRRDNRADRDPAGPGIIKIDSNWLENIRPAPVRPKKFGWWQRIMGKKRPPAVDIAPIIWALERQENALMRHSNELMRKKDYNADFHYEDARRMREAINLLKPMQPKP